MDNETKNELLQYYKNCKIQTTELAEYCNKMLSETAVSEQDYCVLSMIAITANALSTMTNAIIKDLITMTAMLSCTQMSEIRKMS